MLTINQIRRPNKNAIPEKTYYYFEDDSDFLAAFNHQQAIATSLAGSNHFRDAFLAELFALECYLKDIYCLCRHQIYNGNPLNSTLVSFKKRGILSALNTKSFSHDLHEIWEHLCDVLTDLKVDPRTSQLKPFIAKRGTWVQMRYVAPNTKINWHKEFIDLRAAVTVLVDQIFGGI